MMPAYTPAEMERTSLLNLILKARATMAETAGRWVVIRGWHHRHQHGTRAVRARTLLRKATRHVHSARPAAHVFDTTSAAPSHEQTLDLDPRASLSPYAAQVKMIDPVAPPAALLHEALQPPGKRPAARAAHGVPPQVAILGATPVCSPARRP